MGLMFPIYFMSLVISAGLTIISAYHVLELSDLDCDYINPQRCCANLNRLVVPEILAVGLIVLLHLLTFNWIPVATTLPILAWLIYMYRATPRGYVSLYDSTTICDQRVLNGHVRRCVLKITFHLIHFLAYMYMAIISLITV